MIPFSIGHRVFTEVVENGGAEERDRQRCLVRYVCMWVIRDYNHWAAYRLDS